MKKEDAAVSATIGDRMSRNACGRLVGRRVELATLRQALAKGSPAIFHLHGMSGIGKSALLAAFAQEAREAGATVLAVECGGVEPTERGVLMELSQALDCAPRLNAIATALAARPGPILLAFDAYELFGLVDTWIRQRLLPVLPEHTLVLLVVGCHPRSPGPARLKCRACSA
jgi:hypothetical protein